MALPTVFFEDVFNSYSKGWKIYEQHAFKIAILYKNTTKKMVRCWKYDPVKMVKQN